MSEKKIDVERYRRYLAGDDFAAEELIREYSDVLIRFAYCYVKDSSVAEDVVEDGFAALFVRRRLFSDDDNLRAYLYKIVRNKSVDYLRANKHIVPLSDVENVLSYGGTEREIFRKERDRMLYYCLQTLPSQYGEVLYLTYIEGYSVSEVCKIARKTTKQVYNLLSRAKIALKKALEKEGVQYEDL